MELRYTLSDLPTVVARLLSDYGNRPIFALEGELGAGKTTLVRELCRALGVTEPVSSPTFSIVNLYAAPSGMIHHFDCYRLADVEEALEAGLEELLAQAAGPVFVEWPAVIEPLLPPGVVFLRLYHDSQEEGRRRLSIHTDYPQAST